MQDEMTAQRSSRDLVLNPGEYVYMQDTTKGVIKTHVGPNVVSQTGQQQPVTFGGNRFERSVQLEPSVRQSPEAAEGFYLILTNPAKDGSREHPEEGSEQTLPDLLHGRKMNIPGPCKFALWPGQMAKVLEGHHIKSNEFLLCRVYNEEEARSNWSQAVIKVAKTTGEEGEESQTGTDGIDLASKDVEKLDLTVGRRFIVKGTEVSYYIPPTGVEVLPVDEARLDEDDDDFRGHSRLGETARQYVREAVTLEQLEWAVLVDENGTNRHEYGPQVVFPEPTEDFVRDPKSGAKKSPAIELNHLQGVQLKAIVDCEHPVSGKRLTMGTEFFVTGKDMPIFYPTPEFDIVRYGDRLKHYAVAVPEGEGRYVMDRENSSIETVKGPTMLLPDPVGNVIVRRILSDREVSLWYPSSPDALDYNQKLRELRGPSGSDGMLGEATNYVSDSMVSHDMGYAADLGTSRAAFGRQAKGDPEAMARSIDRGTNFTKPRELTLDTKYDGVPKICPYTGYAVMVVNAKGDRRVIEGPSTILLGYSEYLERLTISKGTPKNADNTQQIVYLGVKNNKVSDRVQGILTSDHVAFDVTLSFTVNFVTEHNGVDIEPERWFEVENYIQFLVEHVRSMLRGGSRNFDADTFYSNGVSIVRDLILGESEPVWPPDIDEDLSDEAVAALPKKRRGLFFKENGMRVEDVEVLNIHIVDGDIRQMMERAQYETVSGNIQLASEEKAMTISKRKQEIARDRAEDQHKTNIERLRLDKETVTKAREVEAVKEAAEMERSKMESSITGASEDVKDLKSDRTLARNKAIEKQRLDTMEVEQSLRIAEVEKEAELAVTRLEAVQGGMSEALLVLSNRETMVKVAEAMSVQRIIGGESVSDVLSKVFSGTPLSGQMDKIMSMAEGAGLSALLSSKLRGDSD